ncbi:MAG: hypothetical protein JWQ03_627 [Variovorax sp.]|nr:hypothetical protein [Variovorax sp.]
MAAADGTNDDRASFARGSDTAELRGECPREIVDVLDAVSMARNYPSRNALVVEILRSWTDKVLHEASVVAAVTRRNPQPSDAAGGSRR